MKTFKIDRADIASFGLSLLLLFPILSIFFPINGVVALSSLLSLFISLITGGWRVLASQSYFLLMLVFIFFVSGFLTQGSNQYLQDYFLSFGLFGFCGLVYASVSFNYSTFFRFALLYSLISSFFVFKLTVGGYIPSHLVNEGDIGEFYMSATQKIAPVALMLFACYFYDSNKIAKVLSLGLFFLFSFFIFALGARSAGLSFLIFFVFFILIKYRLFNIFSVLFLLFISAAVYLYFFDIVYFLYGIFEGVGIELRPLYRIINYYESGGDLSSGRIDIWRAGVYGAFEQPLFGNGIATFEKRYGYYVHNLFIQIFYEGGVFLLIPFSAVFVKFLFILFSPSVSQKELFFIMAIFFGGVFHLLFSSVVWKSPYFWFFVGLVLNFKFNRVWGVGKGLNKKDIYKNKKQGVSISPDPRIAGDRTAQSPVLGARLPE